MDSFTAEQARYVTEESRAVELLKKLRRENAFIAFDEAACPHPHRKNRILAEINAIRIFAVFNDGKKMIDYRNEALRLLEGGKSYLLKQKNEFTFGSPHLLYSYYREPGRLKETADLIVSAFPGVDRLTGGGCTGFDYVSWPNTPLKQATGRRRN